MLTYRKIQNCNKDDEGGKIRIMNQYICLEAGTNNRCTKNWLTSVASSLGQSSFAHPLVRCLHDVCIMHVSFYIHHWHIDYLTSATSALLVSTWIRFVAERSARDLDSS